MFVYPPSADFIPFPPGLSPMDYVSIQQSAIYNQHLANISAQQQFIHCQFPPPNFFPEQNFVPSPAFDDNGAQFFTVPPPHFEQHFVPCPATSSPSFSPPLSPTYSGNSHDNGDQYFSTQQFAQFQHFCPTSEPQFVPSSASSSSSCSDVSNSPPLSPTYSAETPDSVTQYFIAPPEKKITRHDNGYLDFDEMIRQNGGWMTTDGYKATMNQLNINNKIYKNLDQEILALNFHWNRFIDCDIVDFHGLPVILAMRVLMKRLSEIRDGRRPPVLFACTGRGRNSPSNIPLIKQNVLAHAEQIGYECIEVGENGGLLRIEIGEHLNLLKF